MVKGAGRLAYSWNSVAYTLQRYVLRREFLVARAAFRGLRFRFKTEDAIGRQIFRRGIYEQSLTEFMARHVKLAAGDVALDIGANIGWYSVVLDALAPAGVDIFAFEPDPLNFRLLTENVAANTSRVQPIQTALSSGEGRMSLHLYPAKNLGRHSLLPINAGHSVEVDVTSVDAFLNTRAIAPARVRFVKMDVEGYEYQVLQGMKSVLAQCPLILAEFSPTYMRQCSIPVRDFLEAFAGHGYTPHLLRDGALVATGLDALEALTQSVDLFWVRADS
jgi:FkbM family methyltransferase